MRTLNQGTKTRSMWELLIALLELYACHQALHGHLTCYILIFTSILGIVTQNSEARVIDNS